MRRTRNTLSHLRERVPAEQAGEGPAPHCPEAALPSPDPLRGPPSPAEGRGAFAGALLATFLLTPPAFADDKAACAEGIGAVKAQVEKLAPDAVPQKLKRALKIAEREQGEGEFDECLEALDDAKRALPK
ncbi:hypothetical protein MPPM_1905 [Methylorubrum populi]|uniref:Uncharacterized protein n=1 Tax=Methylorubrum populi TaxID=223967 RepID=A0A160PGB5_9HYPH|nr:hypothetical protein MPPM_1905 [Methylorubrum populi]